jgi:hypothetical protein
MISANRHQLDRDPKWRNLRKTCNNSKWKELK